MHDEELRHGLGRSTGFGRDDEQRAGELEALEQRRDRLGIDVVKHVKARVAAARLVIEHVPATRPERGAQSDWAERGAADAEDHYIVVLATRRRRERGHLVEQPLVGWQIDEPNRAAASQ